MAKASELIKAGYDVVDANKQEGIYGGYYVTGEEYETWISKVVFFIEDHKENFPKFLYDKVINAAEKAVGNGLEHFNAIIGVLKVYAEREEASN